MTLKNLLILGALCVTADGAQSVSVGVLGGVPFTDVVKATTADNISFASKSANFTVGPTLQVNLPFSLRFEVDALYRPYSFSASNLTTNISAAQWGFPFMAEYRFKAPILKPFVGGGLLFNHLSNIPAAARNITSGPGQLVNQFHAGVVFDAGLDLKLPFVRLSGEIRYTRQGSADFQSISNLNQVLFLVGVHL
jgi:Outer membrane protein beta-barrel domain